MKWGNVKISKVEKDEKTGLFTLWGTYDEEDKDFKKTKKLTWMAADPSSTVEIELVEFDHLITKAKVEDTDEMSTIFNKDSKFTQVALAEGTVRQL